MDASRPPSRLLLLPALLAFLLYLPSLGGDFVYDDRALLSLNPAMQSWAVVPEGFTTPFWQLVDESRDASGFHRPLAVTTFATLWQLGGGRAWPYHLASLLAHAACAVGLSLLAWRLGASRRAGLMAGCVFAVLGAHVEAVSWISSLPDVLATAASLAAMLAATSRRWWRAAAALLMALWFKEAALPVAMLLVGLGLWRDRRALLPLGIALLAWYGLRVLAFDSAAAGFDRVTTHHGLAPMDQFMLSLSLMGREWLHLWWPWPHPIFEPLRLDVSWHDPARWGWAAGAVALAGLTLGGWWRQRRQPLPAQLPWLGLGFVFLALLPVMNTSALGQYPFEERFLYLPSLGLAVAFAVWWSHLPGHLLSGVLGVAFLGGQATSSWLGQAPWQSEEALFSWARQQSPDAMTGHIEDGRLHLELAQASADPLARDMEAERALEAYQASLEIDPDKVLVTAVEREKGNLGLADALYLQGDFRNAEEVYRRTVKHYVISPIGYLGIGNCRAQEGLKMLAQGQQTLADAAFEEALEAFDQALAQKPGLQKALTGKANALAQLGRFLEAYGPALAAYEQSPQDLTALMLLLSLDVQMNRIEEAIGLLEGFLQRYPRHPQIEDVRTTLEGLRQIQAQAR